MVSKLENSRISEMENSKLVRLKVLSDDVTVIPHGTPKEYQGLTMDRLPFDDHRRFLKLHHKVIGFMVSPYYLNTQRHTALQRDGHVVVTLRPYYHINCETIAVIKKEFIHCIIWKVFEISEYKGEI